MAGVERQEAHHSVGRGGSGLICVIPKRTYLRGRSCSDAGGDNATPLVARAGTGACDYFEPEWGRSPRVVSGVRLGKSVGLSVRGVPDRVREQGPHPGGDP
jgi:hypothetical protein